MLADLCNRNKKGKFRNLAENDSLNGESLTLRGLCYTDVIPCIRPDLPEHINKLASWILGQGTRRTEDRVEDMDTSEGSSDLLRLGHANSMCDMLNKV